MENSIEEDIAKVNTYIELVLEKDYCNCNELNTILGKHCDGSKNVAYAMQHILSDYKNVINKIENKIDILDIVISECIYIDDDDKAYKKAVEKDKLCLLNQKRALQELLDGSDTDVGSIGSEN